MRSTGPGEFFGAPASVLPVDERTLRPGTEEAPFCIGTTTAVDSERPTAGTRHERNHSSNTARYHPNDDVSDGVSSRRHTT
jgi:hypothetical protein